MKKRLGLLLLFGLMMIVFLSCSLYPTTSTTAITTSTSATFTTSETTSTTTTSSEPSTTSTTTTPTSSVTTVTTTSGTPTTTSGTPTTSGTTTTQTTTTTTRITTTITTTTTGTFDTTNTTGPATTAAPINVSFDAQGGLYEPSAQSIRPNGYVSEPQSPIKVGFVFAGWVLNLEDPIRWNFAVDRITALTTLTATWTEIVFDNNTANPGDRSHGNFHGDDAIFFDYVTFTYTGAQNIVWTATGARGDVALDGKAILLAGKIDSSTLKATLPNGINSLSFQAKLGFTNTNVRQLEVFLNNVSQGVFTIDPVSTNVQTFTLTNLAITVPSFWNLFTSAA
ncbi:MAG: InlB B-repeat-containing protein [Bacillus subtilis]|nr:InlB B-repeat-containing protein [Bacillus subtilis]